jgi:deoxyribonuclease-2
MIAIEVGTASQQDQRWGFRGREEWQQVNRMQQQQQQQQQEARDRNQLPQQPVATCMGLGKRPVDWWLMLKHPAGYQYSYVDSSILGECLHGALSTGNCWRHRLSMFNPNPVTHTLAPLAEAAAAEASSTAGSSYSRMVSATATADAATSDVAAAAQLAYVIYNDDDPQGTEHWQFAHAKGVAAFSSSSSNSGVGNVSSRLEGFWLLHSAPRFPGHPVQADFSQLQRAQSVFGQHFFCITLAGSTVLNTVAELLLTAGPFIYSSSLPAKAAEQVPGWSQLVNSSGSINSTHQHAVQAGLSTAGGQPLLAFAKTQLFNHSLTDAVVVPGLACDMWWETWRRGHDAEPSLCPQGTGQHSSLNIAGIAFPGWPYRWYWPQDHSKWGISSSGHLHSSRSRGNASCMGNIVCFGDLNRAYWQSHRGGGYVCLQHPQLWQVLSSIVAAVEPCRS